MKGKKGCGPGGKTRGGMKGGKKPPMPSGKKGSKIMPFGSKPTGY